MKQLTLSLIILLLVFVSLRLPGLTLPYHQDEWKTVQGVKLGATGASGLYHPPLTQLLYRAGYHFIGPAHLRLLPFIFSVISALLLWLIIKRRFSWKVASVCFFIYAISFYSVWSSLMIDTDGAILPAIFLLTVFAYDRAQSASGRWRYFWWGVTLISLLTGWLVKLSFVIVLATLLLDFIIRRRREIKNKQLIYGSLALVGTAVAFAVSIFVIHLIYPAFSIKGMIDHAISFVNFTNRNYLQIVVQALKAVMYLSPLLILPLFYLDRSIFTKLRLFFVFLGSGLVFYFVLFDFSAGALDKYLMFIIVPLSIISGSIISVNLKSVSRSNLRLGSLLGVVLSIGLFSLNFLAHDLIPLYPKTDWFVRAITMHWFFLNPFTGGSGPLGFYVSFLFIVLAFLISFGLILFGYFKPRWRSGMLISILLIGLIYNGVFIEELVSGRINGSASEVLRGALSFIADNEEIKQVITYNDIGAYELTALNKYGGRLYATPQFEAGYKEFFANFSGEYLVVNIPLLYQDGFYGKFFSSCQTIFETKSGTIEAKVYRCSL